jgi:hypothetical protein
MRIVLYSSPYFDRTTQACEEYFAAATILSPNTCAHLRRNQINGLEPAFTTFALLPFILLRFTLR